MCFSSLLFLFLMFIVFSSSQSHLSITLQHHPKKSISSQFYLNARWDFIHTEILVSVKRICGDFCNAHLKFKKQQHSPQTQLFTFHLSFLEYHAENYYCRCKTNVILLLLWKKELSEWIYKFICMQACSHTKSLLLHCQSKLRHLRLKLGSFPCTFSQH